MLILPLVSRQLTRIRVGQPPEATGAYVRVAKGIRDKKKYRALAYLPVWGMAGPTESLYPVYPDAAHHLRIAPQP